MSAKGTHRHFLISNECFEQEAWQPLCDVCQTQDGWLVRVDLSGVRRDDVRLTLRGRQITIEGVRRDEMCSCDLVYHRMEIAYRKFERQLDMPCCVDASKIACDYRDGMFLIWLTQKGE